MSSTSGNTPIIPPEQPREDTCEVMYLVKRPSYTLAIAAPQLSPTLPSWEQVVFRAQLKWQGQLWSCLWNLSELEALYEDLQGLVEYLRILHKRPDDPYWPTVGPDSEGFGMHRIPMDDEANGR